MINLLPKQEKEILLLEQKRKLVIILVIESSVALACLLLVLFALKFYMLENISYQEVILKEAKQQYHTPDFLRFKDIIRKSNADLVKANNFYSRKVYVAPALKNVLAVQRPSGVYFTNLSMEGIKESDKLKVTISGISNTRDNLLAFKNNLERSDTIENVYFPPDSWIKPTQVNFFITFEIQPVK